MAPNRLARITAARHAQALGVALLALAACGQAAAQAVGLAGHQPAQAVAVLYVLPLCLFALLSTVPLAVLGAAPAAVAVTAGNTASLASFGTATVAGIAAQLIAAYWLGSLDESRSPHTRGVALAQPLAIGLAAPFGVLALTSHGSVAAILLAAGAPAAAAAGITVRARREARIRTAAGEALADTLTEHTARGERARIARELHDVVAHHISMVAVQAETARLTTPGLPAAGAQRFTEIGNTARAGLTEMRRLLGVLREDAEEAGATVADRHPQPGLPQLAELIDAARQASGSSARLIVSGPVAEFDPGVELAAYRIVQEALTNVRRHAPGAAVDVELRYQDDALHLRIRDNGPGPARPRAAGRQAAGAPPAGWPAGAGTPGEMPGGGHGLSGMRERALAVGGSLRTGAAPGGGFLVAADLPAKPETP
jgi:signal transduction histidine kinase